jgi:dTDP-4-amino-4,6-dideoxygalactose transaminase
MKAKDRIIAITGCGGTPAYNVVISPQASVQGSIILSLHLQPAYAHLGHRVGDFPVAEHVAQECLSLPIYAELSEEEQDRVVQTMRQALQEV